MAEPPEGRLGVLEKFVVGQFPKDTAVGQMFTAALAAYAEAGGKDISDDLLLEMLEENMWQVADVQEEDVAEVNAVREEVVVFEESSIAQKARKLWSTSRFVRKTAIKDTAVKKFPRSAKNGLITMMRACNIVKSSDKLGDAFVRDRIHKLASAMTLEQFKELYGGGLNTEGRAGLAMLCNVARRTYMPGSEDLVVLDEPAIQGFYDDYVIDLFLSGESSELDAELPVVVQLYAYLDDKGAFA